MKINGKHYYTVWMDKECRVYMIHQNELPFRFNIFESSNYKTTSWAIKEMVVRGAGAIGITAGFAIAQAFHEYKTNNLNNNFIEEAKMHIAQTRPTARNLFYAVDEVYSAGIEGGYAGAVNRAQELFQEDLEMCKAIGEYGNSLIGSKSRILTHCNAGSLAFVDYGSALAPIYLAYEKGKDVFVYVDETRPRSQGAKLTAWELGHQGVPYSIIPDNAAAHYMSKHEIDLLIVGADRIAKNGDIANKIGTLEKAICAKYFGIPFYIAAPTSTFDFECENGTKITIEERSQDEVIYQTGMTKHGNLNTIMVCSPNANAKNPAFDVTPAELITGIITEHGIIEANTKSIMTLQAK